MFADARSQVDALAGQLRAVQDLATHTTRQGGAEFERREAAHPWKLRFAGALSTLAANLRVESPSFRHAVRLAVCVIVGEALAKSLHPGRPYWIPMTIALVLKPDFTTTFSRGWQRLLGTLAGLVVSTALFHFVHPSLALEIAFVGLFALVLRAYGPANYGILAIGVTGLVVFLFAITGVSPAEVVMARGLNTLIGGAVRVAGVSLVANLGAHPNAGSYGPPAGRVPRLLPRGERGLSAPGACQRRGIGRRAGRSAHGALQPGGVIGPMRAEPGNSPGRIAAFDRILADSHRLVHALMSLEAGLIASNPVPSRDPFRKFADDVDRTLYFLSAGLRGKEIRRADFPDLREDHEKLIESGDPNVARYALWIIETDRIVNSLNTLTGDILSLVDPETGG